MAGGEGFEPPERLRARWFSRPEHSTTLPPTRIKKTKVELVFYPHVHSIKQTKTRLT